MWMISIFVCSAYTKSININWLYFSFAFTKKILNSIDDYEEMEGDE